MMEIAQSAARIIYDSHSDLSCKSLCAEWAIDNFVSQAIADKIDMAERHWERLEGYTVSNQFEYNDMDNHAYRVEWRNTESWHDHVAFVHTCQNHKFLYVLNRHPEVRYLTIYGVDWDGELDSILARGRTLYNDYRDEAFMGQSPILGQIKEGAISRYPRIISSLYALEFLDAGLER